MRAAKTVELEWAKAWERVSKVEATKQRGKRKNERLERVVQRRRRTEQDGDVEMGMRDIEEEQAEVYEDT